ncbi:MAG: VOC family protein [Proteobacteria bacterium]|nr:VOC family protein [Pseudomonadota bacterium]
MIAPSRPFRVLGVQQVALGAESKARLRELWVGLLGLEVRASHRSVAENVDEDIVVAGAGATQVEIDLMQPLDPARKPRVAEPALNHVGLWVDDLNAAVGWLSARGVRFAAGGIRPGGAGHDVCFIHPKASASAPLCGHGVLIELVQAPPSVVQAYERAEGDAGA